MTPSQCVANKKRGGDKYLQIGIMEVIDEAQRCKGLGRRMLVELVDIAWKGGCVRLLSTGLWSSTASTASLWT